MPNDWGQELHQDIVDAIDEIKYLRSVAGAVTKGESFADIKHEARGR